MLYKGIHDVLACFCILSFTAWLQEACEPGLNRDEEGSNLLSSFPGFKICCIVFCGWSAGGVCRWWWRLLLPAWPPRPEDLWGWSWMLWLIFEPALWIGGLLGRRRRLIKMSTYVTMTNYACCLCQNWVWCVMVLSGSLFLCSHLAEVPPLSQCSRHWWTNMYCSWVHTEEWAGNEDLMFGTKQYSTQC